MTTIILCCMEHILLPDSRERRLIFYLAMEEYVARIVDDDGAFFLWQVSPTVIFGRNQLMEAEVNVPFCREQGIKIFRRKSGGGCVYSDWGNIMISYITKGENVAEIFNRYLSQVASLLKEIGVNAMVSGRNDVQIGGKKVSGNAFYSLPGRSIVHGTLLFSTDFEQMQMAITPSAVKLQSKGGASVRQHVTNLCDHTDMSIAEFKQRLISAFCHSERMLTSDDIREIEEIEKTYLDESFFSGSNPSYEITKSAKISGVGEIMVGIEMRAGEVKRLSLSGDYFAIADPVEELNRRLRGCRLEDAVTILADFDIGKYIVNLTTEQFINLINS